MLEVPAMFGCSQAKFPGDGATNRASWQTHAAPLDEGTREFVNDVRQQPRLCVFDPVDHRTWEDKARRDLKGRALESLVTKTLDGLEIGPLYMEGPEHSTVDSLPGQGPHLRGSTALGADGGSWKTLQEYWFSDPAKAGQAAARDRALGSHGAWFHLDTSLQCGDPVGSNPDGLVLTTAGHVEQLVAGLPDDLELTFVAGAVAPKLRALLGDLDATVLADPLGVLARSGRLRGGVGAAYADIAESIAAEPAHRRCVLASAASFEDAGASDATSLGACLAAAVDVLRALDSRGTSPRRAAARVQFRVSVGRDLFGGIAKLRALRLLWARVAGLCGVDDRSTRVHAVCAWNEWARFDPWVNLLRGTVATVAAAVGGADSIATRPFDTLEPGGASDLGLRLALNTQVILREESHLDRVVDPAGGSHYVERRTHDLAGAAWERFQRIEGFGGLVRGLESGSVQGLVTEDAEARRRAFASGRLPLVGVSKHPSLQVGPQRDRDPQPSPEVGEGQRLGSDSGEVLEVTPLPTWRLGAATESLREAVDRAASAGGDRPAVFLASMGALREHQPRSEFAAAFFAAAGLRAEAHDGYETLDAAVDAFSQSGCRVAVICASDARLDHDATDLVHRLEEAGAAQVFVAAPPREGLEDRALHRRADAPELLGRTLSVLGIAVDDGKEGPS